MSALTVTKSLGSAAAASCQSGKKREQLCVHMLYSHENPALRQTEILISQLLKGSVKQCKYHLHRIFARL